jgi:ATP-dependent RNA helicase DDX21
VGQASKEAGGARTRAPKAVILAPTRELACQVEREIKATAPSLQMLCCYGGVSIMNHERELRRGVDIVVGTPGRMIDLMKRGALDLAEVEFSILDEADQMLSVGFEEDVELLYGQMPEGRTNYLFSATMPVWVKKLARNYLNDPVTVDLIGDSKVSISNRVTGPVIHLRCAAPSHAHGGRKPASQSI